MSHHATRSTDHRPHMLRIAAEHEAQRDEAQLPRWSKILWAREAIQSGHYDEPGVVESKLDDCLDALIADLA